MSFVSLIHQVGICAVYLVGLGVAIVLSWKLWGSEKAWNVNAKVLVSAIFQSSPTTRSRSGRGAYLIQLCFDPV
jgi:hypothetical protein